MGAFASFAQGPFAMRGAEAAAAGLKSGMFDGTENGHAVPHACMRGALSVRA